jgi:ABC-type transport system involved in cytochrome c biogenesis permease component
VVLKLRNRNDKNRKTAVVFVWMALAFISGGMGLKDYFEYSPTIGWIGGFILLLLSLNFSIKGK